MVMDGRLARWAGESSKEHTFPASPSHRRVLVYPLVGGGFRSKSTFYQAFSYGEYLFQEVTRVRCCKRMRAQEKCCSAPEVAPGQQNQ